MKQMGWALVGGLLSVACVGGSGGGTGRPVAAFPSRAELDSLTSEAKPVTPKGDDSVTDVDSWQMEAPAAAQSQYPQVSGWDKLVVSSVQAHGSKAYMSPELRCAAQEAARFFTVNGGFPDDGLREHLLLRCGSTLAAVSVATLRNQVPDSVPDADVEAAARTQIKTLIDQLDVSGSELGVAVARSHGRFALVALSGTPRAKFSDFTPLVSGDRVRLSGEVKGGAQYIVALANQGQYGVLRCEVDPSQRLPAFRFTCPLAPGDVATRIELTTRVEGRVLLEEVARLEVRRDDSAQLAYKADVYGSPRQVKSASEFRQTLFRDLNTVRVAAGLQPFTLEERQSVTDERFAPYLYKTMLSRDDQQLSTISLGLLAGWDVNGLIRDGGIYCGSVNASRNPSHWLTQTLANPLGRWVLLEPNKSRIGIGATELTPGGEMAVVTTYSFFDTNDHRDDEATVLGELNHAREAHGVSPARLTPSGSTLRQALLAVNQNKQSSLAALNDVIQAVALETNQQTSGYLVETTDPKLLKLDPLLLDSSTLDVEIGVTHYRAPGAAWGQYAILFVVTRHGPITRTATRSPGGSTM